MKINVNYNEAVSGDVTDYLLESVAKHDPDYMSREELEACSALTVRDGEGKLLVAVAYIISKRPHGKELEILNANVKRSGVAGWLPKLLVAFDALAEQEECNRIRVSVSRPALQKALEKLRFNPVATMMMRAVR